jgi:signal transduction histidine kinase
LPKLDLPLELNMRSKVTTLKNEVRRKDEFIAMLGHELRNPLSVLTTASRIFKIDGATSVDMKRAAEIIGRQVQHVTRLVNDLLDMERIDHGKLQLDVRSVDLREIVTQTLESRRPEAERRQQSLTMQLAPDPVVVDADAVRLVQVLSNLVDNAVKYTPEAGHINVAVTADGGEAVIVVQDDGAGIPSERVERIFEPFVQLSESRNAARGGMGLGLPLVRRLTELHGGTVEVTSRGQGCGSRFAVHLPLQQPMASSLTSRQTRPSAKPPQARPLPV